MAQIYEGVPRRCVFDPDTHGFPAGIRVLHCESTASTIPSSDSHAAMVLYNAIPISGTHVRLHMQLSSARRTLAYIELRTSITTHQVTSIAGGSIDDSNPANLEVQH